MEYVFEQNFQVARKIVQKKGGYANNTSAIYGLADKAESEGVRILTGTEVKGFQYGSNSKAVTAVETDKGIIKCDNVIIGAGSKILGPLIIGENTKIGANSVVIDDIPENSTVVGVPGKVVGKSFSSLAPDLYHNKLPDPSGEDILNIHKEIEELKKKMDNLKS